MSLKEQILSLAAQSITSDKLFLVDVNIKRGRKSTEVEIILDSAQPVKVTDCAAVSKSVSLLIEEANIFQSAYRITVTSAGMGRPLKTLQQKKSKIRRKVEVILTNGQKLVGILKRVDERGIDLEEYVEDTTSNLHTLANEQIAKIRLALPF